MISEAVTSKRHSYRPLAGPGHFRLMSLEPAQLANETLRFSFLSGDLTDFEAQYEAVLYTWGKPLLVHPLYLDDNSHVLVTASLDQALRQLRFPATKRLLWADAVCINQSEDTEKAEQIPLMTQIFRKARRVLAWVGGGQEEEQGMHQLSILSRNKRDVVELQTRLNNKGVFSQQSFPGADEVIRRFFDLPWFSRLWVIQEIVFNIDVLLVCGTTELSWHRMMTGLSILRDIRPEAVKTVGTAKIEALFKIAQLWRYHCMIDEPKASSDDERYEDILTVVGRFQPYNCSHARDRIYALYSMTSDIASLARSRVNETYLRVYMDVDYSLDVRQTYATFAAACIRSGRVADVLNVVLARQYSPSAEDWLSWVPDWRKPLSSTYTGPEFFCTTRDALENIACGAAIQCNPMATITLPIKIFTNRETPPGLRHPVITEKIEVGTSHKTFSLLLEALYKYDHSMNLLHMLFHLLKDPGEAYSSSEDGINLKSCVAYLQCVPQIAAQTSQAPLKLSTESFSVMTDRFLNALQHQCLFIARSINQLEPLVQNACLTYIGFGNASMQVGDELRYCDGKDRNSICVNDSYALLLRPKQNAPEFDKYKEGYYRLIGTACVAGAYNYYTFYWRKHRPWHSGVKNSDVIRLE